jgi:hypothetical protein
VDAERVSEGPLPVVLVHGALRGRAGLWPTARYLRHHGLAPLVFGWTTRRGSLDDHARALERFIDERLSGRRVERLGFLTHSMGGLVVRAYLAGTGARRQSAGQRVVMLAPPNRGSLLAQRHARRRAFRWLYGGAGRELQPERVRELPLPPASADVLVLAGGRLDGRPGFHPGLPGNDDGVVALEETVLGDRQPELVGGLHAFLQWRPAVLRRAVGFLRTGGRG